MEAGNFRAAVRLLCFDDVPAPINAETLQALQEKHPSAPLDRKPACSPTENLGFQPLQVSPDDVRKCLRTFPAGSSGGPDGLTAQHLTDILNSAADDKRRTALTNFVNLLLVDELLIEVRQILYGGRLILLQKKDGGIRLIAVGYPLRRLTGKCANSFIFKRRSKELQSTRRHRCLGRRRSRCTRNPSSHVELT